ncbi:Serine-threonine/tyrosine-protein kinase, catalytic domain [Dillenia turbinata]|uniref:Serine-threonine/tyrosine-protein kinase, catalytic domain n=1 Tax=Dillenia turbinata TaxID=194707 RepID=A0AAN8VPL0_9MAGN
MDSESGSETSDFASVKECKNEVENGICIEKSSRIPKGNNDVGNVSRMAAGKVKDGQTDLATTVSLQDASFDPGKSQYNRWSGISDISQPGKLKILCSSGGKILPRPSDGKLRYVGGETRIVSIRKKLLFEELVRKTTGICNQPHTIKYQLPGEDLDALISVSSDEDLQNMIEEYYGFEKLEGSQRLRIFLIPLSETEKACSIEGSIIHQDNPDYHYVVAVNGMIDCSPQRDSEGQFVGSEAYRLQTNLNTELSMHRESPSAILPFETKDGRSKSHSNQPIAQGESKSAHTQLHEDISFRGGNDSNGSYITAQILSLCAENGGYQPPEEPIPTGNYHPNKNFNHLNKNPNKQDNLFTSHNLSIPQHDSDVGGFSCQRPKLKASHSERCISNCENSEGMLSGPNEHSGCHHGVLHVLSDSQLEEPGRRSFYGSQEGVSPPSPLKFSKNQTESPVIPDGLQDKLKHLQENVDLVNNQFHNRSLDREAIGPNGGTDFLEHSVSSELLGWDKHFRQSDMATDEKYKTAKGDMIGSVNKKHNVENATHGVIQKVTEKAFLPNNNGSSRCNPKASVDLMNATEELGVSEPLILELSSPLTSFQCTVTGLPVSSKVEKGIFESFANGQGIAGCQPALTGISSAEQGNGLLWTKKSEPQGSISEQQSSGKAYLTDLLSGSPIGQVPNESPGLQSISHQNTKDSEKSKLISATDYSAPAFCGSASPGTDLHENVPPALKLNPTNNAALVGEVSLIDADLLNYPVQRTEELGTEMGFYEKSKLEDSVLGHMKSMDKEIDNNKLQSEVMVEDVPNGEPPGNHFPSIVTLVDGVKDEVFSPRATDAESTIQDSASEDAKAEDGGKDVSISDAMIAEIEAGIYGLQLNASDVDKQIIKNADLEELRELGSGTYGTVYHGKWRGTDVAIKRIKKSCFMGRSSEQERKKKVAYGADAGGVWRSGRDGGGIVKNTLRPPIPDRCDPEWRKLMEQCWSPDPELRPSFTEVTNRLRYMSMALQPKNLLVHLIHSLR